MGEGGKERELVREKERDSRERDAMRGGERESRGIERKRLQRLG